MRLPELRDERGSTLSLVLVFSIIAFITASVFVMGQMQVARVALAKPGAFQARLNAYSGVYRALDILAGDTATVAKPVLASEVDKLFGSDLFGPSGGKGGTGLAGDTAKDTTFLALGGPPEDIDLYDSTSDRGDASVRRQLAGATIEMLSDGRFQGRATRVRAVVAGTWGRPSDTLVYVPRGLTIPGYHWAAGLFDTGMVRQVELEQFRAALEKELNDTSEFKLPSLPLTVMKNDELGKIGSRVAGDLFIDASFGDITWTANRQVVVDGNLQITGDTQVRGVRFVVGGEVRVFDEAVLRDVSIVTAGRVVLKDGCRFSGDILSFKAIVVTGEAFVENRSTLTVVSAQSKQTPPPKDQQKKGPAVVDTLYPLSLLESCAVDGAVVALGPEGHVKVGPGVKVAGIIHCDQGMVWLEGQLTGVVQTRRFVRFNTPKLLSDLSQYRLPAFMGKPGVFRWYEESADDSTAMLGDDAG
jgi:hypothetical protein